MKKSVGILVSFCLCAAFLLAGCQSTPDRETVVQKGAERMTQKIAEEEGGTPYLAELGVPTGPYILETEGADGKLRIHVNAETRLPEAQTLPIAKVSMDIFTQEQTTEMFNYLFPGEKPIENMPQTETKPQIEGMIIDLRRQLAEEQENGNNAEAIRQQIADLEELYQDAPESDPVGGVSDGILTPIGGLEEPFVSLNVSNGGTVFTVSTYTDSSMAGAWGSGSYLLYLDQSEGRIYSNKRMELDENTELPEAAAQKMTVSYGEARQTCERFLEAAGAADEICLGSAFLLDGYNSNLGTDSGNFAYEFYYTHALQGIPLFYSSDPDSLPVNSDEGISVPWSYESICFQVDNEGIVKIEWRDPIMIGETVQAASVLLPFDEIMDVFGAMAKIYYEPVVTTLYGGEVELDITVDQIQLVPLRIREQGAAQTDGLIVPAWIFYGENKGTKGNEVRYLNNGDALRSQTAAGRNAVEGYEGGMVPTALELFDWAPTEPRQVALMAINAVDGSVIDLGKGY